MILHSISSMKFDGVGGGRELRKWLIPYRLEIVVCVMVGRWMWVTKLKNHHLVELCDISAT